MTFAGLPCCGSRSQATVPELATITGHSIRVQSILDGNYFHRGVALAESGIRKLEKRHAELNPGS